MKHIALILALLVMPVQAQAYWNFCLFGCHRAHRHHHRLHHWHHQRARVIVKKKVERIIVEKPAPAPVIIEKHKPLLPLDPVK